MEKTIVSVRKHLIVSLLLSHVFALHLFRHLLFIQELEFFRLAVVAKLFARQEGRLELK